MLARTPFGRFYCRANGYRKAPRCGLGGLAAYVGGGMFLGGIVVEWPALSQMAGFGGMAADGSLHGFFFYCAVVDGEEFFFVEDEFGAGEADHVVFVGEFDGVDGAGFFAHAAVD